MGNDGHLYRTTKHETDTLSGTLKLPSTYNMRDSQMVEVMSRTATQA